MNLKVVVSVILCLGGCNAGVVSRNFKSNESKHMNTGEKSSTEIPRPTQKKVLDTVERNIVWEHLDFANKSISTNLSNVSKKNLIPNVTHEDEINHDLITENSKTSDASDVESNSTSRNISESGLRIANILENFQVNEILNNTDFRNESNITIERSPNDLVENASHFIVDNKTILMPNHSVDLNETFLVPEMKFNGTNISPLKSLKNEADISTSQDLESINANEKFEIPIAELNETKTSGGIFSGIGLDFLINSQVARNAAKAMEVFNFTDPLTDHIFEENEFHSFLDTKLPTLDIESDTPHRVVNQDETKPTDHNKTAIFGNSTLEGNKKVLLSDFNTTDSFKTNFTILATNVSELHKRNEMQHLINALVRKNKPELLNVTADALSRNGTLELLNVTLKRAENETDLLHLTEVIRANETFELLNWTDSLTENEKEFNWTRVLEVKTLEQLNKSSVDDLSVLKNESLAFVNGTEKRNSSVSTIEHIRNAECPPPGFCILWFWSQDACEVDSHCLGSRICCRVRCSKTCIDVENLK